jgi:hypothetical protein
MPMQNSEPCCKTPSARQQRAEHLSPKGRRSKVPLWPGITQASARVWSLETVGVRRTPTGSEEVAKTAALGGSGSKESESKEAARCPVHRPRQEAIREAKGHLWLSTAFRIIWHGSMLT